MSGGACLISIFEFYSSDGPGFGPDETIFIGSLIEHILNLDVELRGVTIRQRIVVMEHHVCLGWSVEYKLPLATIEKSYRVVAHRNHVERDIGPPSNPLCRGDCECVRDNIQHLEVIRTDRWGARIGIDIRVRHPKIGFRSW